MYNHRPSAGDLQSIRRGVFAARYPRPPRRRLPLPHISRAWARRHEPAFRKRDHAVETERLGSHGTADPRHRRRRSRVDLEHLDRLAAAMMHDIQGMHVPLARIEVEPVRGERIALIGIDRTRTRRIRLGVKSFVSGCARKELRRGLVADAHKVDTPTRPIPRRDDPLRPWHDGQVFGADEVADELDRSDRFARQATWGDGWILSSGCGNS